MAFSVLSFPVDERLFDGTMGRDGADILAAFFTEDSFLETLGVFDMLDVG